MLFNSKKEKLHLKVLIACLSNMLIILLHIGCKMMRWLQHNCLNKKCRVFENNFSLKNWESFMFSFRKYYFGNEISRNDTLKLRKCKRQRSVFVWSDLCTYIVDTESLNYTEQSFLLRACFRKEPSKWSWLSSQNETWVLDFPPGINQFIVNGF